MIIGIISLIILLLGIILYYSGLNEEFYSESGQTIEAPSTDPVAVFALPFALVMLLFVGVLVGATPLLQAIIEENFPFSKDSLLATAVRLEIPATVHVAIGTDIIHVHPGFDPEATGKASHLDFRLLASVVAALEDGVYMNVGSAVILPEVFLKALTLVRNMGHKVERFTVANMDFIRHYRPTTNVVERPTSTGGVGCTLIGHHEIMFPLLAAAVIEKIGSAYGGLVE